MIQSEPKMGAPVYLNLLTEGTRFRAAETKPPRQNSAHEERNLWVKAMCGGPVSLAGVRCSRVGAVD